MMFAKPAKKTGAQPAKQKALNKPKAVAVKSGVKPMQSKKMKPDSKSSKAKPPPAGRPDAGYSLYSTDSEDQVATSFREMEACERIITHLKHRQKVANQVKGKGKKSKEKSTATPKALNDVEPGSTATAVPNYGFQYGVSQFLHHIQDPNNPSNPLFNYRLVSSTPDPEKHLGDADSTKPPTHPDHSTQEVPERDISAVSSVPPSHQHVQNMTEMLEIYKQLEMKKYSQVQEAAALAELDRLKAQSQTQAQAQIQSRTQNQDQFSSPQVTQPGSFAGTGSLGFIVDHQAAPHSLGQTGIQYTLGQTGSQSSLGQTATQSVLGLTGAQSNATDSPSYGFTSGPVNFQSLNIEGGRESNMAAFQPYLARDSGGFVLPSSWLINEPQQRQSPNQNADVYPAQDAPQQTNTSVDVIPVQDIPTSGRTDKSDSTNASGGSEYAMLPHPEQDNRVKGQSQPQQQDGNIVYEKQNGLFQIHHRNQNQSVSESDRSGKTDTSGKGSIHEAPERDVPKFSDGTFTATTSQTSQNVSDITTPRTQNLSSTGSTASQGGKIVFIPNDSNTQNVIGYVPGFPFMQGAQQPISLHVSSDISGNQIPSLSLHSGAGNQGQQSSSQITGPTGAPDVSGSGYHSAAHAKIIAAGDVGVRKLRYLLKELRECGKVSKDVEVGRLVTDLDEAVNTIPQLALTFNLHTEIDLAIQPLRTENSQLRRKLRLMNQQLKDKDMAAEEAPKDVNFEMLHLQTSNESLQKKLRDEQDIKTRLAAEVQYLYGEIHKLKVDKSKYIAEISEKETAQLKLRQETLLETQTLRHEVDMMRKDHEMTVTNTESLDKENHILQITLQQRDAEISRQHQVIETMKDSIASLLAELDQSRGGDTTWDQNKSFGLHKLIRIVEEEGFAKDDKRHQTARKPPAAKTPERRTNKSPPRRSRTPERRARSPNRRTRTPERRAFEFNTTAADSDVSTPRLTRAALAYHNKAHVPPVGTRLGPDGRQGPASESELDTLVEMQQRQGRLGRPDRDRGSRPRRRHSSSSPVRLKADNLYGNYGNLRHQRTVSSPLARPEVGRRRERTYGREREPESSSSPSPPPRRVFRRDNSPGNRNRDRRGQGTRDGWGAERYEQTNRNLESSEASVAQSRYSVTDYFKKYPQSSDILTSEAQSPSKPNATEEPRSYQYRTSSQIGERSVNFSAIPPISRNIKQLTLFKGMNGDQTISAIQDDNVSSVSMNSVTTANTVDDAKFRSGIATLDANIAKLQMALQKTKSMLT